MKIKNLIAVAALLLGSVSASAQVLASGGFKLSHVAGTGNPVEIIGLADDYTFASDGVVVIPATLPNTAGAAFKVVGIDDYAFAGLDEDLRLKVKGLKIAASVTYIGENAFADLGNLASVTFGTESEESNLKAIGNGAFAKNPMLTSISFANCPKLLNFTLDGEANTTGVLYNAALPGAVAAGDFIPYDETTAAAYNTANPLAVEGGPAPADWNTYVTVDPADNTDLTADEAAAYNSAKGIPVEPGDPSLVAYDADGAKAYNAALLGAIDPLAPNTYTTPFVNVAAPTNTWLTSITLNTGTLDFGLALADVENLATQNIKDTKIRVLNGFALSGNKKITALELPSKKFFDPNTGDELGSYAVELKANALTGTVIQTLTVNGNVLAGGVAALGVPNNGTANTLTTVTFKGDIKAGGILDDAFKGNTMLKTVTFEGVVDATAVAAGAFEGAGSGITPATGSTIKMTVTALKAVAGAFDQKAFVADDLGADPGTEEVYLALNPAITVDPAVWRTKWEAAAPAPEKIYVECKEGDNTYYAKFRNALGGTSISKNKGDVVVYSAFADGENIYMDPLYSVDDKYVVAPGEPVIVKVKGTSSLIKTDDKGKYIECTGAATVVGTMRCDGVGAIINGIDYNQKITNQALNALAGAGNAIYAVTKISKNGLKWAAISNDGTFYLNDAFYIEAKKTAAGVRVIWLDEEDATAIKNVKAAKAENGAIYNLAGQKVNAAYKGVVIKDGKKYIQK